jgi:hypothetical protein
MRLFVIALALGLSACASPKGYVSAPKAPVSLSGFLSTAALRDEGGECVLVATYKNGQSTHSRVNRSICDDARIWVAALGTVKPEAK